MVRGGVLPEGGGKDPVQVDHGHIPKHGDPHPCEQNDTKD